MNKEQEQKLSKFMSLILRHDPYKFGVELDREGYCSLQDLLSAITDEKRWSHVTINDIRQAVKNCEKQRYEIFDDRIRARYGHSVQKVEYQEKTPPSFLYHGTSVNTLPLLKESGIKSMSRQYVHLSETTHFASLAGKRKGELLLVKVDTQKALEQNVKFYYANGEVWLADYIPSNCIIN